MNALLRTYSVRNVVALGFPCNQFGMQEPERADEVLNCYKYVRPGKGWTPTTNYKILNKLDANGKNEHSLYTYLKDACPPVMLEIGETTDMFWNPIKIGDITWNFEKFLIDKTGIPRYRFAPDVLPKEMKKYIDQLLDE